MITEKQELLILRCLLGPKIQRNYERAKKVVENGFNITPKNCRSHADYRAYRRVIVKLLKSENCSELISDEGGCNDMSTQKSV